MVGVARVKRVGIRGQRKRRVEAESGKELGLCGAESILQLELKWQGSNCSEPLHRGGRASPAEPRGPCEESDLLKIRKILRALSEEVKRSDLCFTNIILASAQNGSDGDKSGMG